MPSSIQLTVIGWSLYDWGDDLSNAVGTTVWRHWQLVRNPETNPLLLLHLRSVVCSVSFSSGYHLIFINIGTDRYRHWQCVLYLYTLSLHSCESFLMKTVHFSSFCFSLVHDGPFWYEVLHPILKFRTSWLCYDVIIHLTIVSSYIFRHFLYRVTHCFSLT